jgi:hypothetical protein
MAAAPPSPLPTGSRLLQDLGVLACTLPQGELRMPTKKPRGRERTLEQQRANPARHDRRLRIAPGNRSVKRCCVVTDRRQLWQAGIRALMMARCCALPNVRVRLTPWQPMVEAGRIVSKSAQKLVGRLTLFQGISQVLSHRKTT